MNYYVHITRMKSKNPDFNGILRTSNGSRYPDDVSKELINFNKTHVMSALYSNIPYGFVFASMTAEPFAYDISIGPFEYVSDAEAWVNYFKNYGYLDSRGYEYDKSPNERKDLVMLNNPEEIERSKKNE